MIVSNTISDRLPPTLRRHATPARLALLQQFVTFGLVGCAGLAVNLSCVYLLRSTIDLYSAGIVAYVAAVATTWSLNRAFTFRDHVSTVPLWRQFASFFGVSLVGFVLSFGTYALMVANLEFAAGRPFIPVCAGAVAGMFANFALARRVVFR